MAKKAKKRSPSRKKRTAATAGKSDRRKGKNPATKKAVRKKSARRTKADQKKNSQGAVTSSKVSSVDSASITLPINPYSPQGPPEPAGWLCELAYQFRMAIDRHGALEWVREIVRLWGSERRPRVANKHKRSSNMEKHGIGPYLGDNEETDGTAPLYLGPSLTLTAKVAALSAIHDHCLPDVRSRCMDSTIKPIDPWQNCPEDQWVEAVPYAALRDVHVPRLDENTHRANLYRILADTEKELAQLERKTRSTGPDNKRTGDTALHAADSKHAAAPVAESSRVKLFDRASKPLIDGHPARAVLRKAQYEVVLALIQAGDKGLTKDQLDDKSGHGDARKVLRRLARSDSRWADVIPFPGTTGGGYRIK